MQEPSVPKREDPNRLLHAAKAIASVYGDVWDGLDRQAQVHYQKEACAVVTALADYDKARHSRLVKEGQGAPGVRRPGRPLLPDTEQFFALARKLLSQGCESREIRRQTGLGNSTITRLKKELESAAHVSPRPTAPAKSAGPQV